MDILANSIEELEGIFGNQLSSEDKARVAKILLDYCTLDEDLLREFTEIEL